MIPLRKFMTIETDSQDPSGSKDRRYTLVKGDMKKNFCKIIFNMSIFFPKQAFPLSVLKKRIMIDARYRVERRTKSGQMRSDRDPLSGEDADRLMSDMKQYGYLKFLKTQYRDKIHPLIPEGGIQYFIFDEYKVIECQESRYFQSKIRRKTEQSETKGKLSEKRCKALRQIYAQFTDKGAFTYTMVINLPTFYKKMVENPEFYKKITDKELTPELKQYYYKAAQYAESRDDDFLNTWNSLVRNNYIIPYEVRTKDGTKKIRQGAYRVNMEYVRRCLSLTNI
jgi:hypothetical protein